MVRTFIFLFVICSLFLSVSAQVATEPLTLVPSQPVEREITGGELHTYQITLKAGQLMRVVVEQKGIDVAVALVAPDGKQMAEFDVSTGAFGQEPLSHEAAVNGDYRIVVRPIAATAPKGAYQVRPEVKAAATAPDKQRIVAERLLAEGVKLSQQGGVSVAQTIEKAQQALTLWRELADGYWEARTLYLIGYAHALGSKYAQAIEYYLQALPIQREIKNRAGEGTTLGSLGFAHTSLSRYEKAIEYHEQALAIHREVKNRAGEGTTLDNLGHTYRLLTRYEKAIEYLEQALVIHREVKNRLGEGTTLNNLGTVYRTLSKHEKAVEYLEQALAIHREIKNRAGEGGVLGNLGNVYNGLSRYEKAIEYYEQALAINREVKNRPAEGGQLGNLGVIYFQMSRYDKAIEYFEQALAISREVKNRASEGGTLGNLGGTYSLMSRYEKAIEYYEQALAISREVKNRAGEENALNNLGTAYNSLGRYEKAIEYHEQALAIHREVKNRAGEASPLNNLGIVYRSLGRYDKAIEYYEQALAIFREARNRASEGAVLSTLGTAYDSLGRYEKAIEYHEQALAISREVKNRAGEGGALGNLGSSYQSLSRYEKAIEHYEQALAINREVKNRAGEGDSLNNLGAVHGLLGRYDKAVESFEQALAIRREVKGRLGEAQTLHAFAQVERNRGNLAQSRALIEQSLQIVETSRSEIYNPQSRASYFAAAQASHEFYIDLLMQQHKIEPAKGLDKLAVEANERGRARGLLELLTEAGTNIRQGVDADLLERERILSRQLNAKATRQMQLLSKTHTPEQAKALRLELSQLENDYERAQAAVRKNSPHYTALTQPQPSSLAEIQRQLDAETLLLEYSLGSERSYLWAITNISLTSYELPKEEQLKQSATQVLDLLTARTRPQRGETPSQKQDRIAQAEAQLPQAARRLSQTLLGPVAAQLGHKRLVIVADGALQYIPFAMLPEPRSLDLGLGSLSNPVAQATTPKPKGQRPKTEDQPLIVNHEVVSLPSASALAIQRAELAGRQPAPKMLAVIADPVFDRSDSRFTTPAAETGDKTPPQTITGDDARSIEHVAENSGDKSGVTTLRLIPRLPFTRQEATRVLALAPKNSSFGAIDFQASRENVLSGNLSQYRYVHIATHGLLDTERPGLSALLFSMVDAQGKPVDGFLRANDIYNLKLPAELVVLSACQTGLGKEIKGEGLVGLTRGFMYAGAARVVVSLWNVNDKATADLMTKFYEKMLKQGERPAAALRAAQVEMWKQKQWQSPYYWAAFTMQGEWR